MDDLIPGSESSSEDILKQRLIDMVSEANAPVLDRAVENINEFANITNSDIPTFSKSHFEKHFLSYFLSGEYTEEMIQAWVINVAGTPLSPVKLVNEAGEVEVIVPALVNTSNINPDPGENSDFTISAATEKFARNKNTFAAKAVIDLTDDLHVHLKSKIRVSALTNQFLEYYKDWKPDTGEIDEVDDSDSDEFDQGSMFV